MADQSRAVMFVRARPGMVGERDREVHVVPVQGMPVEVLTAYCGARFGPGSAELRPAPLGMPCVRCWPTAPLPNDQSPTHQIAGHANRLGGRG
jgi:hypothetical protein